MSDQARKWLAISAVLGALAVVFGAFGAHGVPHYLESLGFSSDQIARRLADFHTAARYHTYAALFLLGVSVALDHLPSRPVAVACWTMLLGVILFSGAVYAVALMPDDLRGLFGRIAPVGGTLMIVAWVALVVAAMKRR